MELAGIRALVVGTGISGIAAARLLARKGAAFDLYDDLPPRDAADRIREFRNLGARLHGADDLRPEGYRLAVVSPGVPHDAPVLSALRDAGAEVIAEVELAYRLLRAPLLAVTGTNGKTTTVEMLGRMLRAAGRRVFVGGNLGVPLSDAVDRDWDLAVAEISSFQLETTNRFRPRVAVLLNITDDHLDRHRNLSRYAAAKGRIFLRQQPGDAAIVNADDPLAWKEGKRSRATLLPYSTRRPLSAGAWAEGEDAVVVLPGRDGVRLPKGGLRLAGDHNLGNALAAVLAAAWVGVSPEVSWSIAREFRGIAHRLQEFLQWRGIRFVDDSKATNVDAAARALQTVESPVIWLAGGVDKGGDYAPLAPLLKEKARAVILVGAAAKKMNARLAGAAPTVVADGWPEAAQRAVQEAREGDTVLLSPACASFDFFTSYAERGETFQRLCREEVRRRDQGGG